MSRKLIKKLDPTRSCFLQLDASQTEAELTRIETTYRAITPATQFRVDRAVYFQFPTTERRDVFLVALEQSTAQNNHQTIRETLMYYLDGNPAFLQQGWHTRTPLLSAAIQPKPVITPGLGLISIANSYL